ncbi:MAG: phosphatidate cytidylyltransferase [Chloroflexi bacterium]|nr:phosphatidate cytidylyltransferase [Chloroflexota bacterium]
MLRTRALTAIVLLPIVIGCIHQGELSFFILLVVLLTLAEFEFCQLVARKGFHPALVFGIGMVWILLLDAYAPTLELSRPGMILIILGSLAWHLFHQQESPVPDWALTVTGGLYLGICGACLIGLRRDFPNGLWWTLTTILSIMFADSGAYFIGRAWGKHKLAPAISPGKTWEGYIGGIIVGALVTALLASLWHLGTAHGLVLGLLVAIFAPIGDLAISMIKRYAGAKDSSKLIPGHGGVLDRVDSILWAAVIGYYYLSLFVL